MAKNKNLIFAYKTTETGYQFTVNGSPLKTPKGVALVCPTQACAEALLKQLQKQALKAELYKLLSFTLELSPQDIITELANHFEDDLTFYKATTPQDLVHTQEQHWQPIHNWSKTLGITPLQETTALQPLTQHKAAHTAFTATLGQLTPFALTTCYMAGKITKSCLISLALAKKHCDAHTAFTAAFVDEIYQQERYGADDELTTRLNANLEALKQLETFNNSSAQS